MSSMISNATALLLEHTGKVDLPGLVQKVNTAATQLAFRGNAAAPQPSFTPAVDPSKYGDPNLTPLILLSPNNDIQFLMSIDGITCGHCVKIVETVLKGCPRPGKTTDSPIHGLIDASADRDMNAIIIKIAHVADARRIAHESARNLSMVGFNAVARTVDITSLGYREEMTLSIMNRVFGMLPVVEPSIGELIRWEEKCQCPDNEVMRGNCRRCVYVF